MKTMKCLLFLVPVILIASSVTALSQGRIQLAQGKRAIQDKVSFVVDVTPDKRSRPTATAPDDMQIYTRFAEKAATGRVYVDGKAVGRFDESMSFNSNLLDVTFGRHTITIAFASPAVMLDFYVTVRGGFLREILDDNEPVVATPPNLENRVVELEQRVRDLETEIAGLKKKRQH